MSFLENGIIGRVNFIKNNSQPSTELSKALNEIFHK